jgi:hypothetical protein
LKRRYVAAILPEAAAIPDGIEHDTRNSIVDAPAPVAYGSV